MAARSPVVKNRSTNQELALGTLPALDTFPALGTLPQKLVVDLVELLELHRTAHQEQAARHLL
jgi:hypothetical protein